MKLRCSVQCYGEGDVHEKVVKELKITPCEKPGVPCVLFVYNVSHETEDLRNALQWVTETQKVRQEDICVVILLEKSLDKESKLVEVAHQGIFDDETMVVRIIWKKKNSVSKIRKGPKSNSDAMTKIKKSIKKRQGSGKDPQGGEILATASKNSKNLKEVQCKVLCHGEGDVHEKIVKELKITPCEGPGVRCVLFVYYVSRENEDLQNALQWVTETKGVRREDIYAVVLMEKSSANKSKPVDVAQEVFDAKTEVVRILWKEKKNSGTKIRKGPKTNKQAMKNVISKIRV